MRGPVEHDWRDLILRDRKDAVRSNSDEAGFGHREDEPMKDPALKIIVDS